MSTVQAPFGFQPGVDEFVATYRTPFPTATGTAPARTLAVGDIVTLDLANTDPDVSNATIGDENSVFANVYDLDSDATGYSEVFGIFAVVTSLQGSGGGDGSRVRCLLRGKVNARVAGGTIGDDMSANGAATPSNDLDNSPDSGDKIIAILLTTPASNKAEVWFNGVEGFGKA